MSITYGARGSPTDEFRCILFPKGADVEHFNRADFNGASIRFATDPNNNRLLSIADIIKALGGEQPLQRWNDLKHNDAFLQSNLFRKIVPLTASALESEQVVDAISEEDLGELIAWFRSPKLLEFITWVEETKPATQQHGESTQQIEADPSIQAFLPLTRSQYNPGNAAHLVESFHGDARIIAQAELSYYQGDCDACFRATEPFLHSSDLALRLSACWLNGFSSLSLDNTEATRSAFDNLKDALEARETTQLTPGMKAILTLVDSALAMFLHLPYSDDSAFEKRFESLPDELRLLGYYATARKMCLQHDFLRAAGIAETALAYCAGAYPIPSMYLHLIGVMSYMNLKQPLQAQKHFMAAWNLAQPDDIISPFAEHFGLMQGVVEHCLKTQYPQDYHRVAVLTKRFGSSWRLVHNAVAKDNITDKLSLTQFSVAMLASRGWSNQEIADHLRLSKNTVKSYLSEIYAKLGITNRRELKQFIVK